MSKLARSAAVLAATGGLLVGTLTVPANALKGDCTRIGNTLHCGRVIHDRDSAAPALRVTREWGDPERFSQLVLRGKEATYKDDDAYFIPAGWYGRHTNPTQPRGWIPWLPGPRWVKITDLEQVRAQLARR